MRAAGVAVYLLELAPTQTMTTTIRAVLPSLRWWHLRRLDVGLEISDNRAGEDGGASVLAV